jgi:hypothetical protein
MITRTPISSLILSVPTKSLQFGSCPHPPLHDLTPAHLVFRPRHEERPPPSDPAKHHPGTLLPNREYGGADCLGEFGEEAGALVEELLNVVAESPRAEKVVLAMEEVGRRWIMVPLGY